MENISSHQLAFLNIHKNKLSIQNNFRKSIIINPTLFLRVLSKQCKSTKTNKTKNYNLIRKEKRNPFPHNNTTRHKNHKLDQLTNSKQNWNHKHEKGEKIKTERNHRNQRERSKCLKYPLVHDDNSDIETLPPKNREHRVSHPNATLFHHLDQKKCREDCR